jgi:hypothetical protein
VQPLVALIKANVLLLVEEGVAEHDAGVASGLVNTSQRPGLFGPADELDRWLAGTDGLVRLMRGADSGGLETLAKRILLRPRGRESWSAEPVGWSGGQTPASPRCLPKSRSSTPRFLRRMGGTPLCLLAW